MVGGGDDEMLLILPELDFQFWQLLVYEAEVMLRWWLQKMVVVTDAASAERSLTTASSSSSRPCIVLNDDFCLISIKIDGLGAPRVMQFSSTLRVIADIDEWLLQ